MSELPKGMDENHQETEAFGTRETESPKRLASGSIIAGRYRIDAFLAEGGMGQVYRAHDLELDVPVALKTIRPEIASNPAASRRFKQEVLLARAVTHTNVCRIFDLWRDHATGITFLTMEFLPGETLAERIGMQGPLSPHESLDLVRQMADALDAAHRAGVVHRDFKSPNVMLIPDGNGGRAVITDFGLAVAVDAPHSEAGAIVGTPAYMSPEQVRGDSVGPPSDLYALGVVLFEICTGQLPFHGTPVETARAHLTTEPPSPRGLAEIEEIWEKVILRLLAKKPTERFNTARDAVLALEGRVDETMATPSSLPAEHDAFIGRATELGEIAAHLNAENPNATRLLTPHGPGGTGKTRLVQKYGWAHISNWPGGIWFCDLSEARTAQGIATGVARSLNVPLGKDDPIVQIGHVIAAHGKCLLILDNFEQLVEYAADTVGEWLERATNASFLVTTQERLRLPQEMIFELEPLDPMTQGVDLFEARAQSHRPGFAVDASNREQVEAIAKSLDGLPLAIELAAARMRMLNLEQLSLRLRDRFQILAGGKKGRHETLRAALDWSWDLLEPWEQAAIAQASVFEGGFTLEAAERIIDLEAYEDAPFILDVIQSLLDKSWLRARAALGAPRFSMYVAVQEFAEAKLRAMAATIEAQSDEVNDPVSESAVEKRHGAYFAEMGVGLDRLAGHDGSALRAALELEFDNLLIACRRAIARRDEGVAAATYDATFRVLELRGPFSVSVQLGRDVLGILRDPDRRARTLLILAQSERIASQVKDARERYDAALALARELGDRRQIGDVLGALAILDASQGRMEEAREHYEAALAIQREIGCRFQEGILLGNLGIVHSQQGRMEEAREHCEAALAIHRDVGNRRHEGTVLAHLAVIDSEQGRMDEAREYYEAALAIHRELGNRRSEAIVRGNLGLLHTRADRPKNAHEEYHEALILHRELGNRRGEGNVLGNFANLLLDEGATDEARERYETALAIHRELRDRRHEGVVLGDLGALHMFEGRMAEANEHYEAALAIHREIGNRRFEGITLGDLGAQAMALGRLERARECFEAALDIHRELDNRKHEGITLGALGRVYTRQHRTEDARRCLTEGLAVLREFGNDLNVGVVLCAIGELEYQLGDLEAATAVRVQAERIASDRGIGARSELGRAVEELRQLLGG